MTERRIFILSKEDRDATLALAGKPVPYIIIAGHAPDPDQNVRAAWQAMAEKYGFLWNTARPVSGKDDCYVSAIPSAKEPTP